jgi:hypothetical protein
MLIASLQMASASQPAPIPILREAVAEAVKSKSNGASLNPNATASVSTATQLKFAMDAGFAHIVITEHLDLTGLPISPSSSSDGAYLFITGANFLTMQVCRMCQRTCTHCQLGCQLVRSSVQTLVMWFK